MADIVPLSKAFVGFFSLSASVADLNNLYQTERQVQSVSRKGLNALFLKALQPVAYLMTNLLSN